MVKKRKYWKSIFRHLLSEYSRFLAMIGIVILGIGVITGLLVTTPNMQSSVDDYYNKYNTADIFMKSTVGFNDGSIDIIKNKDDVKDVVGMIIEEEKIQSNGSKLTSLIYNIDFTTKQINELELIEGKKDNLASDEILVERADYYLNEFSINDKVNIDGNIYTVVGIVSNSWYFSKEAEKTSSGAEKIEAIVYKQIDLNAPTFTDVFITLNNERLPNTFSNRYHDEVKEVINSIENDQRTLITDQKDYLKNNILNNTQIPEPQKQVMIEQINSMEEDLYVFGRKANISFQTFDEFVNKVDSIAKIFPVFFLLVASLVVLTTMTRLVEEERFQVGIMRALGYSKKDIYVKYIFYAFLVGVLGTIIGYFSGFRLLPIVIYNAFTNTFFLPPLNIDVYSTLNMIILLIMVISILLTTIFAVKKTLKHNVARLMLPSAPKKGKRIFLEKIPFIWKRLKFKYKSSFRNIFRYPKHLLMTVLGVAGSLALVFTGFGLNNSIESITKTQFNDIYNFDLSIKVNEFDQEIEDYLNTNHNDYTNFMEKGFFLTSADKKETFYIDLIVTDDKNGLSDFISLRDRKSQDKIVLDDEGVVVSEQIAKYLELDVGDKFSIDGQPEKLLVRDITENYINSKIYMTKTYFDKIYGYTTDDDSNIISKYSINTILTKNYNNINEDLLRASILENNAAQGVNFQQVELEANERLLAQVNMIVVVLVGAAGMLAIIVVYNLANVNISEREKEIATLKVLGYKQIEVSGYVFREILIMTVIGILVGLLFGFLMHSYIVNAIDTPNVMMGRNIRWYTYVLSIGLTLIFTFIVQFLMYFKIKGISMTEAMKEV